MRPGLGLALVLAGCSAAPPAATTQPVTGVVVAIDYSGNVATIDVSGAAEASGRRFGPWRLSAATLSPGATVGFLFDATDGGSAMICAESRDAQGQRIDATCNLFPVRADQIVNGELKLDSGH
jgi:hypothetical protein